MSAYMSLKARFILPALLFAALPALAREAPIDKATTMLAALLSDQYAQEYRAARTIHDLPGREGTKLAFFTLEGFSSGNNYTFYMAVFQQRKLADESTGYMLVGFNAIGGGGWRSVDFKHFESNADCVTLHTKEYAEHDPMSNPTVPNTATYCLKHYRGISTPSFEPSSKPASNVRTKR